MSRASVGQPLSRNQQSLWRYQRLFPQAQTYGMLGLARAPGVPDIKALRRAYRRLLDRHEILRCQIIESEGGEALAHPVPLQTLVDDELLAFVDASEWSCAQLAAFVDERFDRAHQTTGKMLFHCVALAARRTTVEALTTAKAEDEPDCDHGGSETEGLLVFTGHHLVIDFLSFPMVLKELQFLLAEQQGLPVNTQDLYLADANALALAQFEQTLIAKQEAAISAFAAQMASLPQPLRFGDQSLRSSAPVHVAREQRFAIPDAVREWVLQCAHEHAVTPYVVMLSLFQVLLSVQCSASDISVATPLHGRQRRLFSRTIGYFANVLPIRQQMAAADCFGDLLRRNQLAVRETLRLACIPFQVLCERAQVHELRPGLTALTQVALIWDVMPASDGATGLQPLLIEQRGSPYELALTVYAQQQTWTCGLKHDAAFVPANFVERFIEALPVFAQRLAQAPCVPLGNLGFVQPPDWHCPADIVPSPAPDLIEQAFVRHARERADEIALREAGQTLTHAELERMTRRMASVLLQCPTGGPVGILMERGIEAVLAMLSAFRAGIAFAPLHPEQAPLWLAQACEGAGLNTLIFSNAQQALVQGLPVPGLAYAQWREMAQKAPLADLPRVHPLETAYLIHTSGSTGAPKGVVVSRSSLQYLMATTRFLFAGEDQRWVLAHHASFDFALWELFGPLVHGHSLTVLDERCVTLPEAFFETILRDGITHLGLTPAACRLLLPLLERRGIGRLRCVCAGGSAVDAALANAMTTLGLEAWSFYGPTEVTVWASSARIGEGRAGTRIGRPFAGLRAYVLDEALRWVPEHCVGELYLAGPQVAGYLRPAATATSFVPDPWQAGQRMYRTGDRVRYTQAEGLEFVGRVDRQTKLNGYRIELDAITHLLSGCEGVAQLTCLHLPAQGLCAPYTTADGQPLPVLKLAAFAREVLPKYMLPVRFLHIRDFPLTRNRKPDLAILAEQLSASLAQQQRPQALDEARWLEEILAVLRQELGAAAVQADRNFHELGATSIILARLHAHLVALAALAPELVDLYTFTTPRSLARWLAEGAGAQVLPPAHTPAGWQGRRPRALRLSQHLSRKT